MKHLKTYTTIISIFLGINLSMSQVPYIDLTFTGSYNGMHVPLDSIRIINESQVAADTMLYGNDTVLRLEYETGIDESILGQGDRLASGELYPNPSNGRSSIDVFIPGSGMMTAQVSDMNGRVLLHEETELQRGVHNFSLVTGNEGIYTLTMKFGGESLVKRYVNATSSAGSGVTFTHHGLTSAPGSKKSVSSMQGLPFSPGDILRFIGFAASDRDTLQDTPTDDTDYVFEFTRGGFSCPGIPDVEYGGQTYSTVQIGSQCWLRENLDIGDFITSDNLQSDNEIIEKYCYLDLEDYCDTYGGLYRWNEMMQYVSTAGGQGICPPGWHIPEEEEWIDMMLFLGTDKDAGGRLKEAGTEHWNSPNTDATNQSGYTALPAGQCEGNAIFTGLTTHAYFWTSTTEGFLNSKYFELRHNTASLVEGSQIRTIAKSVRCIKD